MKIRLFAITVSGTALALALSACSGNGAPTVAAAPATTPSVATVTPPASTTTPVVTETPESNPYQVSVPSATPETTQWNAFVADAKERISKKFGPNDIANGDVLIHYFGENNDQVLMVGLQGKAGGVLVYPMGNVDPYVYYTPEAGKDPNLATMMGGDETHGIDYASSTTEKKQRNQTAHDLAKKLLDELLPAN